MAPPLLQLGGIALTFGGTPLLEGVDLTVAAGERVCLVGRNGSGKSTLLKIVAGYVAAGLGPHGDAHAGRYLLEQLGLTGEEDPATLSGGEARRAALVRV